MVQRRSAAPPPVVPARTPVSPRPAGAGGSGGGWVAVGLIVAAVVGVNRCSSSESGVSASSPAAEQVGAAQQALTSAVGAQTAPPVQPLSAAGARLGASRIVLAARERLAGELIYSQNCYDALGRDFAWRKLDECGGFDVAAAAALGDEVQAGSEKEIAWFDPEAAAGRYLKAAIAAGEDADAADARLADLQRREARARPRPRPSASSTPTEVDPEDEGAEPANAPGGLAEG